MTQTQDGHASTAPELKQAVLAALLAAKDANREVTAVEIRQAQMVLDYRYSERTLWRWVRRGEVPSRRGEAWTPTKEQQELLMVWGTVTEVRRQLAKDGDVGVCVRTMQRGFQAEVGTVDRTFARSGYDKAHAMTPTSAMPLRAVNDEWSMDDTQLPVWCIMPGGEVAKPPFQGIRDAGSRAILGFNVTPYVFNTEDAVENIAKAVAGYTNENGVFVGGKPRAMRTDRGSIFVARATGLGLVAAAIERRYSEAYAPQGNGGIERWHRTFKALFRDLPGYDWADFKRGDRRKIHAAPPKADLPYFEEVVVAAAERVRWYNNDRVHSSHGMTPMQCWERDVAANPDLVRRADPVALRAAMQQHVTRKLNRRRIEHDKKVYNLHPQSVHDPDESSTTIDARAKAIRANEGHDVDVRFLHSRVEFVSVYTLAGQYLGDAVWDKIQTVEQAGETANARREHVKTMNASVDRIAEANAAGIAVRKAEARAEIGLHEHDQYDVCDEECDVDCTDHGSAESEATPGRKHRTSKAGGSRAKTKRTAKAPPADREPTPSERRAQQRRDDAARVQAEADAHLAARKATRTDGGR
jgi:transposase InsO family protein